MRRSSLAVFALVMAGLGACWPAHGAAPSRPNIIFILADDYGIPGVGCYGGEFKTPNLDALAAGGIRFDRCFSAPLCGPSRAMCMFGRYAFRTGVLDNGSGLAARPDKETCIAKVMKDAGYTTAIAGKWRQLGYFDSREAGKLWGWDESLVWGRGDGDKGSRYWDPTLFRNGEPVTDAKDKFGPDLLHDFVVDFIRRNREQPFFVYYPTTLIHGPLRAPPGSSASKQDLFGANIQYMDKLVGKLVAKLDEMELRQKTLIIFTGDNGNAGNHGRSLNGRKIDGGKASLLEGGSRVPLIANWKGTTPAGLVSKDLVEFTDFFTTFAELGGARLPDNVALDSHSFAPQLRGEKGDPRAWVYIQLGKEWYAREDRWKLNERGDLFDMSDAPYAQKLVPSEGPSPLAQAARQRLQAALDQLNPAAGKAQPLTKKQNKKQNKNGNST